MKFHDVHFTPLSLIARKGHFDTYEIMWVQKNDRVFLEKLMYSSSSILLETVPKNLRFNFNAKQMSLPF